MTVTEILDVSKTRCKVMIDQEFAFVLHKGELRQYHLQVGEEVRIEDYRTILEEVLPKRARARCLNLLKSRDYTVWQLRNKLCRDAYPRQVVEDALDYAASFHYIDDLRYARNFIEAYADSRSRMRIVHDLASRGVPDRLIRQAWGLWEESGGGQEEEAVIRRLLEKKGYDPEQADYVQKGKLYASLVRKGFAPDQVQHALDGISWT